VAPSIGAFGQTSSFVMQFGSAGGGDVILTIKDMSDNTCLITTVIQDPGSCSTLCEIVDPQFNNLVCNDNGTNDVPIDDFLEFSLDPVGIELSTSYFVSLDTGAIIPEFAPYDTASYFTLYSGSATQDSIELHVQDSLMPSCFYDLTIISPGTCSPECKILDANLDTILCNNNGTPSDVSDDRIEFTMAPHGYNLNKNYTVIVSSGTIMPTMGAFEKDQLFNLQAGSAGNGDVIVKVKDIFDQTCPLDVEINDPGTCSPDCEIFQVQLADVQCNNNNTLADFTDDFLSFSLTPDGFNIDDSYILGVSQGSIVPNTALFGETTSFALQMGSAGAGDVTITIYNASDSLCFTEVVVTDPGSCSPNCAISDLQLADLMCHDNETAHDTLDDYLSFSLTPIGFNIGSKYTIEISEGSISPDTGFYNQTATFELSIGSAGSGDKVISLTDVDDPTCITQLLIYDPGHCSDICLITENNLTNITCNDNGTSTDSSDDFLSFSLKPLGGNTAGSYNIFSDSIQLSPETGVFGEQMNFTLEDGSAGSGNQMISIVDLVDTNCVFMFELVDPGSCSPDCEIISFGLENVFCNDNNTGSDGSDDYVSIQIKPMGFNTGESFNLDVSFGSIEPDTGLFNVFKEYKISAGSAGAGDIEVILSSAQDSMCKLSIVIEDPGSCSPQCEILDAIISDIVCNDNGTSANNTDDYLSFSMALEGFNLEGEYIISSSIGEISPNQLSFDGVEDFVLSEGTAGAGDIEITITNTNDGSCVFMQLIPNTGDCSNDCLINNTTVENLHCEDNNTSDDPTDDFISFSINPKGFNVSDSFKISTLNWAVSPNSGKYGVPGNYSLSPGSAGTGLNLLRIVDAQDTLCFKNVLLTNPGSCSEECNMVSAELGSVMCNDNETPTDSLDDYISFELNPSGYNLDGEYLLFSMNGIVVPSSGSYNEVTLFKLQEGSAGKGDVNILVIDANDNDCEIMVDLEDPGPCSDLSATVDFSNKWNIVCYPNPVSSAVFLDGLPENARIEIRNIIGKMVFSSTEVETNSSIDLSNWSSGLYMLSVYQGREQIFAEKLIKQ
jgi:hypothetical protein